MGVELRGTSGSAFLVIVLAALWCFLTAFVPPGERPAPGDGSLIVIGSDVRVDEDMEVQRAVSIGGDVRVLGHVVKDAVSVGGTVFLGPDSRVEGNVVSIGGTVEREPGSFVGGEVTIVDATGLKSWISGLPGQGLAGAGELWKGMGWASSLAFFLMALIMAAVMPGSIGSISWQIEHSTGRSIFWGLFGSALIFPAVFMLFISIVGIILVPALIIVLSCALVMGYVAVAQLLGKRITIAVKRPGRHILVELALGYAALFVMGLVPMAGWIIKSAALLLGFGGVLSALTARRGK